MAKRVYNARVELEAENENDFADTPFETAWEFAAWLSRHANGEGDAGRFACNLHGMVPAPGSHNRVEVSDATSVNFALHIVEVMK